MGVQTSTDGLSCPSKCPELNYQCKPDLDLSSSASNFFASKSYKMAFSQDVTLGFIGIVVFVVLCAECNLSSEGWHCSGEWKYGEYCYSKEKQYI